MVSGATAYDTAVDAAILTKRDTSTSNASPNTATTEENANANAPGYPGAADCVTGQHGSGSPCGHYNDNNRKPFHGGAHCDDQRPQRCGRRLIAHRRSHRGGGGGAV